ncbi:hypothetical protein llap_19932 [Limosa lapponica baueri]|uniref:Uncharacterized protein n=1 Tax=Limosa lapponica baueri TaxID=1758121 RepID=A0A2I0T7I7_LIMLA|nr:hypothetical protein llap_19932 [Limosa lapponica baueri]
MGEGGLSLEEREQKLHLEEVCDRTHPAQHRKERVLYIMDERPMAGHLHALDIIILEAISKGKKATSKSQWLVVGKACLTSQLAPVMAGVLLWL